MTARDALRRWGWLGLALALTLFKLWLTRAQGVFAIADASYDDGLFVDLARQIAEGRWLGPYNELTLAKGAFYPLFIAGAHTLGLPLFLAQHLFYAAAGALFARALRPAIASAGARCAIYLFLLWNPMSFEMAAMGRVLRQHIYGPLAVMIFAALIALYLRRDQTGRRPAAWAVLLGAAASAFYLTREEGIWIAPSVALLGGAWLFGAWRISREALRRAVQWSVLAAVVAAVPVLLVCAQNRRHYGWFGTSEMRAPAFTGAYGAMLRVKVGPELPYVPVTRQARQAMAAVSPAFAELQVQFDAGLAQAWAANSISATKLPAEEQQIGGGWMTWALREATVRAGHGHHAAEALAFYARLADELNAAADSGRIPAGPPRRGFVPPWREGQTRQLLRTTREFAEFVVHFNRFSARSPRSSGSPDNLALFREFTGEKLSPLEGETDVGSTRVELLQAIGKALRPVLLILFFVAQVLAVVRLVQSVWLRQLGYPLVVAAAAWAACLAVVVIHALIDTTSFPVLTISSFAPIYPLLLIFIAAMGWEVTVAAAAFRRPQPERARAPAAAESVLSPRLARALPWIGGALALVPFVLWQGRFRELFWFGDDWFLIDQMSYMGLWHWTGTVFSENFVPLFKVLWGGAVLLSGSYLTMLWLMWLTHALNTVLFGRLLGRTGFAWPAVIIAQVLFALPAVNLETLGWSVQWSALLATTFLLLALDWAEKRNTSGWRLWLPLAIFSAASACSFSRGVLTGPVVTLAVLWPALAARDWRAGLMRLPAVVAALLPALAVGLAIKLQSSGNHQHLGGHEGDILEFAACYFLFNPLHTLLNGSLQPLALGMAAGLKLGIVAGGLFVARGRVRQLLAVLLVYDLGNSLLLGIGRYHTGFEASMSSRYQYGALLATLPFLGVLLAAAIHRLLPASRPRTWATLVVAAALAAYALSGWPAELAEFTGWRGTEVRRLLAGPDVTDPAAMMPTVDFIHVERAKALQRAYDLH